MSDPQPGQGTPIPDPGPKVTKKRTQKGADTTEDVEQAPKVFHLNYTSTTTLFHVLICLISLQRPRGAPVQNSGPKATKKGTKQAAALAEDTDSAPKVFDI